MQTRATDEALPQTSTNFSNLTVSGQARHDGEHYESLHHLAQWRAEGLCAGFRLGRISVALSARMLVRTLCACRYNCCSSYLAEGPCSSELNINRECRQPAAIDEYRPGHSDSGRLGVSRSASAYAASRTLQCDRGYASGTFALRHCRPHDRTPTT